MIDTLADLGLGFVAVALLLFVCTYVLFTDWWSSPIGRAFMALMFSLGTLVGIGLLRLGYEHFTGEVFPEWIRDWARMIGYWIVGAIVLWLWVLLLRGQLGPRRPVRSSAEGATMPPDVEGEPDERLRTG
jgi:hypothetical protein